MNARREGPPNPRVHPTGAKSQSAPSGDALRVSHTLHNAINRKKHVEEIILSHLSKIEASEAVRVVYACESGSRAWGFPSADSDYDVRFLYLRPINWYLSIEEKRDVIEFLVRDGLDICGWDLKKALQLFRKSNPPLLEWLGSPIVYLEKYSVANELRALAPVYYSSTACLYHYLHMAQSNYREFLKGDEVWLKKYLYVLRPILAMRWIELGFGVVPTDFNILVDRVVDEPALKIEIEQLLAAKRAGAELDRGPRIIPISDFIEQQLTSWENKVVSNEKPPSLVESLDELFRKSVEEVWQS